MQYVYFLKSEKDGGLYIGKTNNLERRFSEHVAGRVSSTKGRRPVQLLGYEVYDTEEEARLAELQWKKGYKREELKKRFNLKS